MSRAHRAPSPGHAGAGSSRAGGRAQPIIAYETDLDEAIGVATALRRARSPGAPWSSLAVLARTNAQLVLFERELEAAGVPFRSGAAGPFLGAQQSGAPWIV